MNNYKSGRRFEYEVMDTYRKLDHQVMRTAGSHGLFDVITISPSGDILLIQCKRTKDPIEGLRLCKNFKENPPLGFRTRARYHQMIAVKVARIKKWLYGVV